MVIAAVAMLMFLRPIWDIDIFWHIAAGRWMVTHGEIATTDIFGLDPERPWITFQWGYQVLAYHLEQLGGWELLRAVHAAAMALAFALLYRTYRRRLQSVPAAIGLLLLTLMLFQDRINVRPHIFNLLGLAIMLPALLGGWRQATRAQLAGWALWFGLWANLHAGGCFIMLVASFAVVGGALFTPERPDLKRAIIFWAACAVPALLSPNFITGNLSALMLVKTTQSTIGEWRAPIAYLPSLPWTWEHITHYPGPSRIVAGLAPYLTLLTLGGLAAARRLRGRDLSLVAVALAFTGLSLLYVRFVHFCAPVWLIMAMWFGVPSMRRSTAIGILTAAMLWHTNIARLNGNLSNTISAAQTNLETRRFPVAAADFLESIGFRGTVFCHARYGGYLLWRLHPDVRTLIDGRSNVDAQVANDVQFVHKHHRQQLTDPELAASISAIYDLYSTDAIIVETPAFAPWKLNCERWLPVYRTPKLEVYMRNSPENSQNLARAGLNTDTAQSLVCNKNH